MNEFEQKQQRDYGNAKAVVGLCREATAATRRTTPAEEAARMANFHYEQSSKHSKAAAFFASNPQFGEFIELIRAGVISIYE